jgi:hypothetical protein
MMAVNHALPGFRYRIRLEPLDLPEGREAAARELFDRITALGRAAPDQYNWMNLAIRHRETNTIARLGFIPEDEHLLEERAIREDDDPFSVRGMDALPASRAMERAAPRRSGRG